MVDHINSTEMNKLDTEAKSFQATEKSTLPATPASVTRPNKSDGNCQNIRNNMNAEETLVLKVGAQVMCNCEYGRDECRRYTENCAMAARDHPAVSSRTRLSGS